MKTRSHREDLPTVFTILGVVLLEAAIIGAASAGVAFVTEGGELTPAGIRWATGMFIVKALGHMPAALPLVRQRLGLPPLEGTGGNRYE